MSIPGEAKCEIPIVLTATVVPLAPSPGWASAASRLTEYVQSLGFYRRHAPVIFLENSNYPLEQHVEFRETPGLQIRRFPPSANPERGKGFQEFEMLDAWLAGESHPPAHWLKITGRYQVMNVLRILEECRHKPSTGLIIDQIARATLARTHLFCVNTGFYQKRLAGLYCRCDDRNGEWIERVLFRELKTSPTQEVCFFRTQPRIAATAGSSGAAFPTGRAQWLAKQALRSLNRLFDRQRLWYPK